MKNTQNKITDEIYFRGGLNTDDDPKLVPKGDYTDAKNVINRNQGNDGVVENIYGNSEVENTYLPAGTNKCIGTCVDEENNSVIIFNYNSNSNHGIYRYLKSSDTFQKILHNESILGFQSDCNNLQAHVIGGLLYWNEGKDSSGDYINVPRKINIEKARNHTNSLGGDAYDDITVDTISAIKKPLIGNIYATLLEDASYSYNFLNATYYQFTIEAVFDDNEKSVLSNRTNFVYTEEGGNENYVGIRFYYDDVGGTVAKLNILYKESIISDFIYGGAIDVSDPSNVYDANNDTAITSALVSGTYYFYRFYGKSGGSYYIGTSSKLYDVLPIYANSQEYVDKRIMYGGGRIGYDKTDIDIDFDVYNGDTGYLTGLGIAAFNGETYNGNISAGFKITGLDTAIFNKLDIKTEYSYTVVMDADVVIAQVSDSKDQVAMYGGHEFQSTLATISEVRDAILDNFTYEWYDDLGGSGTAYTEWENVGGSYVLVVCVPTQDTANSPVINTRSYVLNRNDDTYLLHGTYYQFCVFLFDEYFRTTGALINEDTKIYVPLKSTLTGLNAWGIEWTNNATLPSWVRYVAFGYSRCLDFTQAWQISSPVYSSGNKSFVSPNGYVFADGDLLRIYGDETVYQIDSGDEDYIYMEATFSYSSGDIEILRPRDIDEESKVFYEISRLYSYDYVNEYINGDIGQDNGFFVGGDFTNGSHLDSNGKLFYNFRRIIPELDDYGSVEYQSIYYSQKYFANTKINGLNRFDFSNKVNLDDSNGDIIDLKRVGEVLYAIQESEITSFYLGKAIVKQSSTGEITADTSNVLGGRRESAFDYGSIFKTIKMNNQVFGFDIHKGVFWMSGYNGVNVISSSEVGTSYKMDSYFKDKALDLISSGISNINVKLGADKKNELIFVSFIDSNDSSNNDTIAYHYPSKRWISRYSFVPENYEIIDNSFYSFDSGKMYLHNDSSADRCTFYGTAYESYIRFISNMAGNIIKIYTNLEVHSNKKWHADDDDAIISESNGSYPNVSSKILDGIWELEEGVYKSEFMRNGKSTSSSLKLIDLHNGDFLRSHYLDITLTNDDTDEARLFKVCVYSEPSS